MPEPLIVTVKLTPAQVRARVAGDEVSGQVALDRMAASKALDDACRAALSAEAGDTDA
jgi:ribosomal protein S9